VVGYYGDNLEKTTSRRILWKNRPNLSLQRTRNSNARSRRVSRLRSPARRAAKFGVVFLQKFKFMQEFRKFPKGIIKRNHNFYGWAFVAVMFLVLGGGALLTGELHWRSFNLKGNDAYLF